MQYHEPLYASNVTQTHSEPKTYVRLIESPPLPPEVNFLDIYCNKADLLLRSGRFCNISLFSAALAWHCVFYIITGIMSMFMFRKFVRIIFSAWYANKANYCDIANY